MSEQKTTELNHIESALQAGAALVEPKSISRPNDPEFSIPFVVVPNGHTVKDIAHLFSEPAWRKGSTTLLDTKAFIDFVRREDGNHDSETVLYGTKEPAKFTAVFNDKGRGDCTAVYECPLSRQWKAWIKANKVPMSQVQFAEFLEDNRLDIAEPSTAELLEVAQNISATTNGSFKSKVNRVNGNMVFGFSEETTATAGDVSIPEVFKLAIPILDGGEKWEISARLRYRLTGSDLKLFFDLDQHVRSFESAINDVWLQIERETALPIYHGQPTIGR